MAVSKVMQKAHNVHATPAAPAPIGKKRAREADAPVPQTRTAVPVAVPYEGARASGYRLEPHICRVCHSRVGSWLGTDGRRAFECTNCGLSAQGHSAACMCCCGIKLRKGGKSGRPGLAEVDAGIRCIANPVPTPEFPSLYVAGYVEPAGQRPP